MRSASGNRGRPASSRIVLALAILSATLALGCGDARVDPSSPEAAHAFRGVVALQPEGSRRLDRAALVPGAYTTGTGEVVRVQVSDSYGGAAAVGQRWADYLASLLHGSELTLATVYVVTPDELRRYCGPYALGCYGGDELVFSGETVDGVTPEEVATHEYGHHVAANRVNPPWRALDWGPKRWSSAANICLRARQNAVFPEDHAGHYRLHPGEGWAEVYRVLNEARAGGTTFGWPIVDQSFYPDAAALQAAEQDVVDPWTAPTTRVLRARFTAKGRPVWSARLTTPLDGNLTLAVRFPRGALHEVTMLSGDGRTVLARGLWADAAEKRVTTTACGERSVLVRVARAGMPTRFTVRIVHD